MFGAIAEDSLGRLGDFKMSCCGNRGDPSCTTCEDPNGLHSGAGGGIGFKLVKTMVKHSGELRFLGCGFPGVVPLLR